MIAAWGFKVGIKAVIFDLDGTLIKSKIPFRKMKTRIIKYLREAGVTPSVISENMMNFEIMRRAVEDLKSKDFPEEYIREVIDEVTRLMNEVELESADDAELIPSVPETVKALKSNGLRIGLMTRSCRKYVEKILKKFGLLKYFDAILARDDVVYPKPDPSHAIELLKILNASVKEAIFVGDHWSDAECARRAGLRFVWFRHGENWGTEDSGILKVSSIKEILEVIQMY
ncbi:HAD family hydrolase [Candidatus Bathyarchaeota archaeon]|nr:MAG: HAD family hydrolase [Candidatus Bathyarchaeota archaeon]